MRRLVLVALVLGSFSSLACSSAPEAPPALGAADGGAASPAPGNVAPGDAGKPSEPSAPPPKAEEVTEQFGVFVAPSGAAGNPGSRSAPLATIAEGIDQAVATKKGRVFVCEGTYAESLELANGVSIVGGLDCSTPTWKLTDKRSTLQSPTTPAIRAANITTATRLDNLDVVAPSATVPSGSSVGLLAIDSNALTFAKGSIRAGDGMKGDDGVEGAQLAHVLGYGPEIGQMPATAPAGVTSDLAGGFGKDGVCNLPDGAAFARTGGGKGGSSGIWSRSALGDMWSALPQNLPSLPGPVLGTGAAGTAGVSGADGALTDEGYAPADGTAGTNGDVGRGGVGGAGKAPPVGMFATGRTYGESGAGGGSGGCPGLAGTAGKGGGASLAAALVRSPVRFDGMLLQAGNGGAGGRGTFGSDPTQGTPGANDGSVLVIDATKSNPGGAGGAAGVSGHGAGGPSVAIAHAGLAPILTQSTTKFGAGGAGLPASPRGARTIPAAAAGVAVGVKPY